MKQITLNIKDNKFRTFLEFIKTLDYVELENAELAEFKKSLSQVKQIQDGKLPKQSISEFLDEI